MDHQQANQPITTHPLPQPFGNQSSNFVGIHQWIASSQIHHPFSEAASLSWRPNPVNGVHFCRRFLSTFGRNSRFPSRLNLFQLSFSRFSVGISPAADLEKDELNTRGKGETFHKSQFVSRQKEEEDIFYSKG